MQPGREPTEALVHPDPQAQYDVVVNMDLLNSDPQAKDGLSGPGLDSFSIQGLVGLEGGIQGRFGSVVDFILGRNRSNPIWRLRLLAGFNLVFFLVLFLAGYLHGVHATYRRVMLQTCAGIPVVVAAISLFASCWLASDPDGRSNWTTGLSVANVSMLGGALAIYLVLHLMKTGN